MQINKIFMRTNSNQTVFIRCQSIILGCASENLRRTSVVLEQLRFEQESRWIMTHDSCPYYMMQGIQYAYIYIIYIRHMYTVYVHELYPK